MMTTDTNKDPLGFLGILLFEKYAEQFSEHHNYEEFRNHLEDFVNDLAYDHVANVLFGHAENNFHYGDLADAEPFVRKVMELVGRCHPAYGKASRLRGHIRFKQGNAEAGLEYLKLAVTSFLETRSAAQLEDMRTDLEAKLREEVLYREEFQQTLNLCESALQSLQGATSPQKRTALHR